MPHYSTKYPNSPKLPIIETVGDLLAALAHLPSDQRIFTDPRGKALSSFVVMPYSPDGTEPGFVVLQDDDTI